MIQKQRKEGRRISVMSKRKEEIGRERKKTIV